MGRLLAAFAFVWVLSGCNGTSGANGDDPFGSADGDDSTTSPVVALSLEIGDADCNTVNQASFNIGDTACITATITEDGTVLAGEIVSFTSGIGTLSVSDKLTNSNGEAIVYLDSDSAIAGASTITATYDSTSSQANIEFLIADTDTVFLPTLSLTLSDSAGNQVSRITADETGTLSASLVNIDDTPITDAIVSFQVSRGSVSIDDALTTNDGLANSQLLPTDNDLGAGTATASYVYNEQTLTATLNYEIQSSAVTDEVIQIGTFDNGEFVAGLLGIDGYTTDEDVVIAAGATLGVNVALVNSEGETYATSIPVTFSSVCVANETADIDETVFTASGQARSTFQDNSCAGNTGFDDEISATVTINSSTLSVSRSIEILPETAGSIAFIDASPSSIVISGTGGQDASSVSRVTFQVNSALGNPLAQQEVAFNLNSNIGGLALSPATALTNSEGQVSTFVTAGSVPTAVRVTAVTEIDDTSIQSQSDLLSVNTGLPDQNSISLSPSSLNPEAHNINGNELTITASAADAFNNPVPDGTTLNFTTEGGLIEPSCTTESGSCSVTWTSAEPRVADHRITVMVTAVGHETLIDANGNNLYDDADGGAITGSTGNGISILLPDTTGFIDYPEAWRDDNEDGSYDATEPFFDYDSSGSFTAANGLFDGPQCDATSCGNSALHVRRAMVVIMSSSSALLTFNSSTGELANNTNPPGLTPVLSIPRGSNALLSLAYSDTANQPLAEDTEISITSSEGGISGSLEATVPSTNAAGNRQLTFVLTNLLDESEASTSAIVSALVTSPSGVTTSLDMVVTLQ